VYVAQTTEADIMRRFLNFVGLVFVLTALMYAAWFLSATLLPAALFRPYFARLFSARVGEFTFWSVFLANLLPFFGIQFMNLFKVREYAGGIFVLPVFWVIYGLLLGTNSFVFAGPPMPVSISILWERTGFNELLAYTLSYEATREWALWEQLGLWRVRRLEDRKWSPQVQDWIYWVAGLVLLILAVVREVQ